MLTIANRSGPLVSLGEAGSSKDQLAELRGDPEILTSRVPGRYQWLAADVFLSFKLEATPKSYTLALI